MADVYTTCTIETNPAVGRYLAATRDIKPGEIIFKESPLVIGPRLEGAPVCLGCFRIISNPHTCNNCHLADLCSTACENSPNHAGKECELLANAVICLEDFQYLTSNYDWVLPFRIMVNLKYNEEKKDLWEKILQLEAHMEKRKDSWIWNNHKHTIIDCLQNVGLIDKTEQDEELAQRVCGILDVNSFEIRSPENELLRGIYLEASMMCHDCIGNTHLAIDHEYNMTVRASLPIAKGDKILFNYTAPLQGTEYRKDILKKGKYFDCNCVRCEDPTELGTYMSAIKCPKCKPGYIIQDKDKWNCQDCKKNFSSKMIQTVLDVSQSLIEDANKNEQHALEILLKNLISTFHANHFIILELKQRLLGIYRDMILLGSNMSSRILQRDIELCNEVLPVIEMVEPGISRLKGITLYTLHLPIVLLANKEYQCGILDHNQLLSRLEEAEGLLKEALALLFYEPPKTPEGMLALEAKDALKCLRETIMDVKDQVVSTHMRSVTMNF